MKAKFSELHAYSAFSFLLGSSQPETMIRRAAELGYESIAITDRMGFYGSARAHHAAKECGIRALVGSTLELPDGSYFPVICASRDGYRMLSRHLTDRHLLPGETHDFAAIGNHLIALTGDRSGPLCKPLLANDRPAALLAAENLIRLFGHGNVYVEIHRHGLRDDGRLTRQLIDLASHLRLSLLASNAPLHATRSEQRLSADFITQGASTGPHPMRVWRERSGTRRILRASDLLNLPHGIPITIPITIAGMAICRQRPSTAKGHCFISLEDDGDWFIANEAVT